MRALLVAPPPPNGKRLFASPPLGLLYVCSAIRNAGHDVDVADLYSFNLEIDYEPYDFIGVTGMSFQHNSILKIAHDVKQSDDTKVVGVGGPHATAVPELLLASEDIDFVFRGEFETQAQAVLDVLMHHESWGRIAGMCFRDQMGIHVSQPVIVDDPDELPFPSWNAVDVARYSRCHHGFFYEREPVLPIITSRGCPYGCTFCAAHVTSGRKWRFHSPGRVMSEIDGLVSAYKMRELHIEDDNFCQSLPRSVDIMKRIIGRRYDLKISFPNGIRIDRLNDEILSLMRRAGVYSLTFGIESGSPAVQRATRKGLDLDFVRRQIEKVKSHGFYVHGFFILGFPYETEDDMKMTIRYAKSTALDSAFFGAFVPLAGSVDFDDMVTAKRIDLASLNWDGLSSTQPFTCSLSSDMIEKHIGSAYRQFYLRPRTLFTNVRRIKSLRQLNLLSSRIWVR